MRGLKEYPSENAEFLYYTPSELERAIGIWPLHAGRMIAKPNYISGPRQIRYYNLHYILDGQVVYAVNGEQVTLKKGDLFCLFPDTPFTYKVKERNPKLRMTWIGFNGEGAGPLLQYAGITEEKPYCREIPLPDLPGTFRELLHEFRRLRVCGGSLQFVSMICALLAQLAAVSKQEVHETNKLTWIQDSETFMNVHYAEGITVQDVADYVGLHRTHFSSVFSKKLGISPIQYLQRLRMRSGAKLLADTDLSVTEIALSLGYPDLYSFTRAFRKYYGASPTEFRNTKYIDE
ncbi:AraC family transcriptional regulator [Paenibacillus filicis]|uniref:AraC family transcriptional regulator n=1 Tax=Paenibacillus gyeongsangnamensis TaxID=3388067 RepID=A0ABT4Q2D2_9BACL|nr:AraC family transcriptional regulator [Paenibacillus filicis]MCZ8510966.1 AraC family transcriptional regulator [Paenibacillus filicis]